jgi:hypothetical protein
LSARGRANGSVLGWIRLLVYVVYTDSRLVSTHIFVGGCAESGHAANSGRLLVSG